jgi:hypothetical protein
MAVKHIDLEDKYIPRTSNEDIIVEVEIGDAGDEVGSYAIFLGTKFISADEPANLGTKSDLTGKKTTISVTIPDVLQETNWTSMTVFVTEGDGEAKVFGPYRSELEHHLDTAIYTLKLTHQ